MHQKNEDSKAVECTIIKQITTIDEKFDLQELQEESYKNNYLKKIGDEATHVIYKITYGAITTVNFKYKNSKGKDKNKIKAQMEKEIDYLNKFLGQIKKTDDKSEKQTENKTKSDSKSSDNSGRLFSESFEFLEGDETEISLKSDLPYKNVQLNLASIINFINSIPTEVNKGNHRKL